MKTQLYLETKEFEMIYLFAPYDAETLLLIHFEGYRMCMKMFSLFFSMKIPDLSQDEK